MDGQDASAPAQVPSVSAPAGVRLAAVVHLDMVDYSRLMGLDEAGTLARLRDALDGVLRPLVEHVGGRVANTAGDSVLLTFAGVAAAVRCALAFQRATADRAAGQAAGEAVRFGIGVTVADVLEDGADVHGDGVNVAARLQAACPAGAVCVSRAVRDQVQDRLGDVAFQAPGTPVFKGIARPVEAYVARPGASDATRRRWRGAAGRLDRAARTGGRLVLAAMALLAGGVAVRMVPHHTPSPAGTIQAAAALPDLSVKNAPRLSLVVLPFANTSGDPGQDYLADAATDDQTTDLARVDGAFVIGRGSAQTYRGRAVDARRVGGELGVRYIVQGSVRRVGEGVARVQRRAGLTETGEGLWAERFDHEVRDLGRGQGDIVRRLVIALGARLVEAESARGSRARPDDPDAFDLVLRARSLMALGTEKARLFKAQAPHERALE